MYWQISNLQQLNIISRNIKHEPAQFNELYSEIYFEIVKITALSCNFKQPALHEKQ